MAPSELTIVMYHYVRDLAHSRFPELKALDFARFRAQLDHLQASYAPVSAREVTAALDTGAPLPDRACLLTFDDGYLDHYTAVFPELVRRGLSGAFYPAVLATRRTKVMEVNKIQLVLAQNGYANVSRLVGMIREVFDACLPGEDMERIGSFEALYEKYARPSRFDGPEVIFFKSLLQFALPPGMRTKMIDALFSRHVSQDEEMIAQEMYLSVDMLRVMAQNGMHIGSHGNEHLWLDKLAPEAQAREIDASLRMLREVYGKDGFLWSMCYPFGGNNASLRRLCAERGCAFAVTTVPETARVSPETRFTLARLDTNDLPADSGRGETPGRSSS